MFEERIYLSHENYKKIDLKSVKGELVLAVNIISTIPKATRTVIRIYLTNCI